jgi:hypothetical protein
LVSGRAEEEILKRNEYPAVENEILKSKIKKPLRFNDSERIRLAKIGKHIGLKALKEIACIVKLETILEWFQRLVAKKLDGCYSSNQIYFDLGYLLLPDLQIQTQQEYNRFVVPG